MAYQENYESLEFFIQFSLGFGKKNPVMEMVKIGAGGCQKGSLIVRIIPP